ncbi:MAG: alpha-glucosidase [Rhodospirillales bacterium]|nr:alpha-glucosidase [Rhodospirillales bacterium]
MSQDWWRGAVIYQIYPWSFADANGDGIGDLAGITRRLDYVAGLGVDGIWLSPFFVSPMKDFGYDVADYCDVDPLFGTLADFDALLAAAHRLGLKVIIDQVYSHSSDAHPWFAESRQSRDNPKADWYVWADPKPDGTPPNNWLAVFGGAAWTWDTRRRQYYLHNFLPEQPDLNFHNKDVQDAVLGIAAFWLDRGVDGFRIDVANLFCHDRRLTDNPPNPQPIGDQPYRMQRPLYNRDQPETLAFVSRFRALLDRYSGRMAVAELASTDDQIATMIAYIDGPDRYHTAYSFLLMREDVSVALIRGALEAMARGSKAAWPAWAFSNHDVVRVASRWAVATGATDGDPRLARLLIAVLTALRGTVFVYQGEELGLPQADVPFARIRDPEGRAFWPRNRGRDGARTPMPWRANAENAGFCPAGIEPWLPVDPRHAILAADRQDADSASVLAFTRRFLAWRKRHPALVRGDIRFLDAPEPVLAFERTAGTDRVLCAFNLGAEPRSVALDHTGAQPLDAPALGTPPATVDGGRALLPPWGALILE